MRGWDPSRARRELVEKLGFATIDPTAGDLLEQVHAAHPLTGGLRMPVPPCSSRPDRTGSRGTLRAEDEGLRPWLPVVVGESSESPARTTLPAERARRRGLAQELSRRPGPWLQLSGRHDLGKVVLDLSVAEVAAGPRVYDARPAL